MIDVINVMMDERRPSGFYLSVNDRAREQYEGSYVNVHARRDLYDFASPNIIVPERFRRGAWPIDRLKPAYEQALAVEEIESGIIDIERKITAMLQLSGDERIIDVGCSDGTYLWYLYFVQAHSGELLGLDKYYTPTFNRRYLLQPREKGVEFILNDASERIMLLDDSVDVVLNKFVVYHSDNPIKILDECQRVLRPDGTFLLATRGINNMRRLWEYADIIGAELSAEFGIKKPNELKSYYHDFDLESLIEAVEDRFQVTEYYEQSAQTQDSYLKLKGKAGWMKFYAALFSLKDDFNELTGRTLSDEDLFDRLDRIIMQRIYPIFIEEAATHGFFREEVEQVVIKGKPRK